MDLFQVVQTMPGLLEKVLSSVLHSCCLCNDLGEWNFNMWCKKSYYILQQFYVITLLDTESISASSVTFCVQFMSKFDSSQFIESFFLLQRTPELPEQHEIHPSTLNMFRALRSVKHFWILVPNLKCMVLISSIILKKNCQLNYVTHTPACVHTHTHTHR